MKTRSHVMPRRLLFVLMPLVLLAATISPLSAQEEPQPTPGPQPSAVEERQARADDAPPEPSDLGAVTIERRSEVQDVRSDVELLSAETGVPTATIESNIALKDEFLERVERIRKDFQHNVALVRVPDIVSGAPGQIVFVGKAPAEAGERLADLEVVVVTDGAVFSETEQIALGELAAASATALGFDWTVVHPGPDGVLIELIGADLNRAEEALGADLASRASDTNALSTDAIAVVSSAVTAVAARPENRVDDANTTNGGTQAFIGTGNCTTGFTTAYGSGGQSLAIAAHCTPVNGYVWEHNPELNQYHLYRTVQSTYGGSPLGDVARMVPVQQWQLDQWYGTNVYLQGDPEPYFMANFTFGKRQVHAEHNPNVNEYVCYIGASNLTRTCNHQVVATNRTGNSATGTWGKMTYTTVTGNLMQDGSSGGTVSYNNTAFGLIKGSVVTGSPINGWPAGSQFNVFTPMAAYTDATSAQVCTTNNLRCYGTA